MSYFCQSQKSITIIIFTIRITKGVFMSNLSSTLGVDFQVRFIISTELWMSTIVIAIIVHKKRTHFYFKICPGKNNPGGRPEHCHSAVGHGRWDLEWGEIKLLVRFSIVALDNHWDIYSVVILKDKKQYRIPSKTPQFWFQNSFAILSYLLLSKSNWIYYAYTYVYAYTYAYVYVYTYVMRLNT